MEDAKLPADKTSRQISVPVGVLTLFSLCVLCFFAGTIYRSWSSAKELALLQNDGGNMKSILVALSMYSEDYDGWCPPDFATLAENNYLSPSKVYICNGSGTPVPETVDDIRKGQCDFYYFGRGKKMVSDDSTSVEPIIATKPRIRKGQHLNVGYNNGSVHFLHWPPHMIKQLIKQSETSEMKDQQDGPAPNGTGQ